MPEGQGESVSNRLELTKISDARHWRRELAGAFQVSGARSTVAKVNKPAGSEV
jgi:hypothetical protein